MKSSKDDWFGMDSSRQRSDGVYVQESTMNSKLMIRIESEVSKGDFTTSEDRSISRPDGKETESNHIQRKMS